MRYPLEVIESVKDLPAHWRMVLVCAAYNRPYTEIASFLNIPVGTVKSRLHRANKYIANWTNNLDKELKPIETISS